MRAQLPSVQDIFRKIAIHADVAASICLAVAEGKFQTNTELSRICNSAGLSQARSAEVERFLLVCEEVGLFERSSALSWRIKNPALAKELAPMLNGVKIYRNEIHQDENLVDVVITRPPAPSQIAEKLESFLSGGWKLQDTKALLPAIAESARHSFVVMSPFIDEMGAEIVVNLYRQTKARERYLIIRADANGCVPPALKPVRAVLNELGVKVLNVRAERPDGKGNETFHAKVILADDFSAYVGSSNMHKWSFEYSLELGLHVRGVAARRIAEVIRAVISVASPV